MGDINMLLSLIHFKLNAFGKQNIFLRSSAGLSNMVHTQQYLGKVLLAMEYSNHLIKFWDVRTVALNQRLFILRVRSMNNLWLNNR